MSHRTPARTNQDASDAGQPTVLVVGGVQLGLGLAERLARTSFAVTFVGEGHVDDPCRVASFAGTRAGPIETAAALSKDVERRLRRVVTP